LIVTLRRVGDPGGRATTREPKELVARGYDAVALRYAEWAGRVDSPAIEWVRELDRWLDDDSNVLELGCGRGVPATRELARRHRVTGVDISAVQIELARHHVPEASFVHDDVMALDVAAGSLDAVVALFLFGHLPQDDQRLLLTRIGEWLHGQGHFLCTLPTGDAREEVVPDWLGAPMFFATLGGEAYEALLRKARLGPTRDEVIVHNELEHGEVAFRWILAQTEGA
jgi:SAM-dependent methyltransferase